jgi:hypothetical protein
MGSRGVVRASTSEGAHTSYRSSCGNISRSLGRTATTRRYVLRSFSLYIFFVNCLDNNLKFNLQPWPFNDAASRPLLGFRWSKITHLTGTIEGHYMTYSIVFDCITSGQVRQHLLHVEYLVILTSVEVFQICRLLGSHTRPTRSMVWLSTTFAGATRTYGRPLSLLFATT